MSTAYMTYDMKGIKEEFADWVSDISPEYTPFISMIKKFPVENTKFQWQVDVLDVTDAGNAHKEGSEVVIPDLSATVLKSNNTQIMRKVIIVSETANAVASYGREKELFYQIKKASKELKRDNEGIFLLADQAGVVGTLATPARTASLGTLIDAGLKAATTAVKFEEDLFALTEQLYTEGAEPDLIMYHPSLAKFFAALQEKSGTRERIFENDKRFVKQVEFIVDPLGQELKCVPNRWCPAGLAYILNMDDVGMAVLRAPHQTELAKTGSYTKVMIEQEVGLRLNNPKAAAVLTVA